MSRPRISLIAAVAENGVIGRDNQLPWRIPEDLKLFKQLTMGKPIVMGRKTFESIGRPLPGRQNLVLTRGEGDLPDGCTVVHSIEEVLSATSDADEIMIIGGGEIYELFMPHADHLYITLVHTNPAGHAFFPKIDEAQWQVTARQPGAGTPDWQYEFLTYERRSALTRRT